MIRLHRSYFIPIQPPKQPYLSTVPHCYLRMYCRLRNPKLFRSLPYCRVIFNNIISNIDCSFFDIIFQRNTPRNTFLHCMRGIFIYDMKTLLIDVFQSTHIFYIKGNTNYNLSTKMRFYVWILRKKQII